MGVLFKAVYCNVRIGLSLLTYCFDYNNKWLYKIAYRPDSSTPNSWSLPKRKWMKPMEHPSSSGTIFRQFKTIASQSCYPQRLRTKGALRKCRNFCGEVRKLFIHQIWLYLMTSSGLCSVTLQNRISAKKCLSDISKSLSVSKMILQVSLHFREELFSIFSSIVTWLQIINIKSDEVKY